MSAYWNGENYYDPTAGAAIAKVDRQNRNKYAKGSIRILERDGICRVIYTEALPCSPGKAACIIPAIRRYGTGRDIQTATSYLVQCLVEQKRRQDRIMAESILQGDTDLFKKRLDEAIMLQTWAKQNITALMEKEGEGRNGDRSW